MHWQESTEHEDVDVSRNVVDVAFRMHCRCLPVDHAYPLLQSVEAVLPWLSEDPRAGIHSIHVAESGHGWRRPGEGDNQLIQLSKRVRLVLRVPRERVDQCAALSGRTLYVSDQEIELRDYKVRSINPSSTLFARRVVTDEGESEEAFIERAHRELVALDTHVPKLLPGRCYRMETPTRFLVARSLLLADVPLQESIRIQETGLGHGRNLGCGLFIRHKSL